MFDSLQAVGDDVLGPRNERGEGKPVMPEDDDANVLQGGTHFERNLPKNHREGVKGSRCYTLGLSLQTQRSMLAPSASGKIPPTGMGENEHLRKRILEVREPCFVSQPCRTDSFSVDCLRCWHEKSFALRSRRPYRCAQIERRLHLLASRRNTCECRISGCSTQSSWSCSG